MALNVNYTKERHTGRWVFSIVLIVLLATCGWYGYKWYTTGDVPFSLPIVSANTGIDESVVSISQVSSYTVEASKPRYISIPTLSVGDTRIFPVALDAGNQIETPANINDASWYDKSATPGSGGVVLMSGHVIGMNHDGAFKQLSTLAAGARINVTRGDGKVFSYEVVENKTMTLDEVSTTGTKTLGQPVVSGKEGLNIIVADGKWVPRLGTFDRRIILRAAIVE
jgi:hypothetical protein